MVIVLLFSVFLFCNRERCRQPWCVPPFVNKCRKVSCQYFQESFARAQSWISELQKQASPSIIIALAGNKTDLENLRAVQYEVCVCSFIFLRSFLLRSEVDIVFFINIFNLSLLLIKKCVQSCVRASLSLSPF